MLFAQWIKDKRKTFAEVAVGIDVSNASVVHRYAAGKRIPQPEIMERITAYTEGQVSPADHYAAARIATNRAEAA